MPQRSRVAAGLAVLLLAGALPAAAMEPAEAPGPTANRRASAAYDATVRGNPSFRAQRAHIECDPIESADLRAACLGSFDTTPTTIGSPPPAPAANDPMHPTTIESDTPVGDPKN